MFETPSLSFVPCRPPGESGVTRLWQDARKRSILTFDFSAASYLPHSISAGRIQRWRGRALPDTSRPSDPHLVLPGAPWRTLVQLHTTLAGGGSALMAVSPPALGCLQWPPLGIPSTPRCQCLCQPQCQPPLATASTAAGNTRMHESRDGCPPRALPDLCESHTDRDSAALRSVERDILGNGTAPPADPRVPGHQSGCRIVRPLPGLCWA